MASQSSSSVGSGAELKGGAVRIMKHSLPPDEWTKVNEVNMENRAPCQIWRSGVNRQLLTLQQQLSFCKNVEKQLEMDIQNKTLSTNQ